MRLEPSGKDRSRLPKRNSGLGPMLLGTSLGLLVAIGVFTYVHVFRDAFKGSDNRLRSWVSEHEALMLGDETLSARPGPVYDRNPWAGASRRRRSDLIVAVPGCGGIYRPSSGTGSSLLLRYVMRKGTTALDSTQGRPPVSVVLGTMQVSQKLDAALHGVCAGEAVRVSLRSGVEVIAAIIDLHPSRGQNLDEDKDDDDRLATSLRPIPGSRGRSCDAVCSLKGLICQAAGFKVLNNCPRLRTAFPCTRCEVAAVGTSGADMPCFVSANAPEGHSRGFCMVNPISRSSTCDATYKHTRRLCPCVNE